MRRGGREAQGGEHELQLIHVVVQQKPTQRCKAIYSNFKNKKIGNKEATHRKTDATQTLILPTVISLLHIHQTHMLSFFLLSTYNQILLMLT